MAGVCLPPDRCPFSCSGVTSGQTTGYSSFLQGVDRAARQSELASEG